MTISYQIYNRAPIGSLLKKPGAIHQRRRKDFGRSPRIEELSHLRAIRECPCLNCGMDPCGEAAHVRMNQASLGKRTGMGEKPSDKDAVPLCPGCHRNDPDSQHKVGELTFWDRVGLNPLLVAQALHQVSPDIVKMRAVVFSFVAQRGAMIADHEG